MRSQYDVAVLGSGAAGLTAALSAAVEGASVAVFEKADGIGGSSALSGGGIWIPGNSIAREQGVHDSKEEGFEYLMSLSNGLILPELAQAMIDGGEELLTFLHEHTEIRPILVPRFPDYHPEHPYGMRYGGRTLEPGFISPEGLGEWSKRVNGEPRRILLAEMAIGGGTGVLDDATLAEREEAQVECGGRALIIGLLRACLAHDIDVFTNSRASRLVLDGDVVAGVELSMGDGARTVGAGAVVLATGGFEYDPDLVRDFLRGPLTRGIGAATNTGDGLRMAMRVGAQLGNMREAWWAPVITTSGTRFDGVPNGTLISRERALPGSVMVNRYGKRFANEAANYNALGGAFHRLDESRLEYPNVPAYLIFDQRTVDRFGVFGGRPGEPVPAWMQRADTLAELAGVLGLPAGQLEASVERFNEYARAGVDPDFTRGQSAFDRFAVGITADRESPYSTLAPLEVGPFYGAEVASSALGTKGGPRTDTTGRVLNVDGQVIRGLYAAGNVMASPAGMMYGGGGATLVIAGIWGIYAGRAAVRDLPRQGDNAGGLKPG